ncbi:Aldo/keto reductase [Aspergillus homomorphus CBS 101889]|uniref:Aldo/keto reductase n=1 Tax=Aspergillus homomorphus (strain CBS 101889) TaxID=1450537 RepID=A0A395HJ73_ASPHC|nr:Aldo/keto reductase [Aspergillus homomorphus CBS 101889]RAL07877.1 Aldo/keto reductase [Aspergillus homomorphus CBS 101889]
MAVEFAAEMKAFNGSTGIPIRERTDDTSADIYGASEDVLGRWFAANPEKRKDFFLATKFGIGPSSESPRGYKIDSTPECCREALERSLKRLDLPYVNFYYVHRLDKVTPIEKTMEAMVQLKQEGKIKLIGLSECSAESLRRAHAVHPVTCVQVEYILFYLAIESPQVRLLETAQELGVGVVAYSPLGNGDISRPGNSRRVLPGLHEKNLAKTWLLWIRFSPSPNKKGDDIFAIPGITKIEHLEENLRSVFVRVSEEEEPCELCQSSGFSSGSVCRATPIYQ